jgi:glycosyltransferase
MATSDDPRITIITAVRNSEATISECLESITAQDVEGIEHLIMDGESTDGTLEKITNYKGHNVTITSIADGGPYEAMNRGIARAKGEIVGLLHADDKLAHNNVLSQVLAAFNDPQVDAIYGDLQYTTNSRRQMIVRTWRSGEFSVNSLKRGWMPPHPTLYVRRKWYHDVGLFDTRYRIAADYHWMLRFLSRPEISVRYIQDVMVTMRVGGISNRSLANILRKTKEDFSILVELGASQYGAMATVTLKNIRKLQQFL